MTSDAGRPATFVLIHGAFHGGWCWRPVRKRLEDLGHTVFTPTQTGLGERAHLLAADITMDTFVADIVNVIVAEELTDVVLVGHSFGTRTAVGVADVLACRLSQLIFLDGGFPQDGRSRLDTMAPDLATARIAIAEQSSNGLSVPPPPAERFGLRIPDDIAWVNRRVTPQPFGAESSKIRLNNPIGNGLPCTYIRSIRPEFDGVEPSARFAREHDGWTYSEIEAGHDAMISDPDLVAFVLHESVQNSGTTPRTDDPSG